MEEKNWRSPLLLRQLLEANGRCKPRRTATNNDNILNRQSDKNYPQRRETVNLQSRLTLALPLHPHEQKKNGGGIVYHFFFFFFFFFLQKYQERE
jgi:hypothetical protein